MKTVDVNLKLTITEASGDVRQWPLAEMLQLDAEDGESVDSVSYAPRPNPVTGQAIAALSAVSASPDEVVELHKIVQAAARAYSADRPVFLTDDERFTFRYAFQLAQQKVWDFGERERGSTFQEVYLPMRDDDLVRSYLTYVSERGAVHDVSFDLNDAETALIATSVSKAIAAQALEGFDFTDISEHGPEWLGLLAETGLADEAGAPRG